MTIKSLSSLKREKTFNKNIVFVDHLIVGSDYAALKLWKKLSEPHKKERGEQGEKPRLLLMDETPISTETLFPPTLNLIRKSEDAELLKKLRPELELSNEFIHSIFYKDQKFRNFDGRSKPMTLLGEENFFSNAHLDFDVTMLAQDVLPYMNLDQESVVPFKQTKFVSIAKNVPTDLLQPVNWIISTADNTEIHCTSLYWTSSLLKFVHLYQAKSELTAELIEYAEAVEPTPTLVVEFKSKKEISKMSETVFLPQSLTYDWGHFIGEFRPFDELKGWQSFKFIAFLHEKMISNEEIEKKIKNLRSIFKRIFEKYDQRFVEEKIKICEKNFRLNFDDIPEISLDKFPDNFNFINASAPLRDFSQLESNYGYPSRYPSGINRLLLNIKFFEHDLHS